MFSISALSSRNDFFQEALNEERNKITKNQKENELLKQIKGTTTVYQKIIDVLNKNQKIKLK